MSERKKMRYVGTLTSSNTSVSGIRLRPGFENAVQVAGTLGGVTNLTLQLGNKDEAGTVQYGDVADNSFSDEFSVKINNAAEFAQVTSTGADGSTDLNVYATTL